METTKSTNLLRLAREILSRKASASEEEGAESGFTLIELMVVLLIMAILLAIAIPTFLGAKTSAQNRAVQSNLTNAITSGKTAYTNNNSLYGTAGTTTGNSAQAATALKAAEPELTFVTGAASNTTSNEVSVFVSADGQILIVAGQSANGSCWYAEDNEESQVGNDGMAGATTTLGVTYASNGSPATAAANCTADNATPPAWSSSYPAS